MDGLTPAFVAKQVSAMTAWRSCASPKAGAAARLLLLRTNSTLVDPCNHSRSRSAAALLHALDIRRRLSVSAQGRGDPSACEMRAPASKQERDMLVATRLLLLRRGSLALAPASGEK